MRRRPNDRSPGPASVPDRIADALRGEILRGRYRAGDRLPSERELAERFDAHRGAVREALKKLEQLGVAEIRRGGARAAPIEDASLDVVQHLLALDTTPDPDLFDQVFEVFGGLFALSARVFVERAGAADRERALAILERMTTDDLPLQEEHALVQSLAELFVEASGNMILTMVRRSLQTRFIDAIDDREVLLRPPDDERGPLLRRLAETIAERDAAGAANAAFEITHAVRRNAVAVLRAERDRTAPPPAAGARSR